jgi:penicillin G amidase
MITFLLALFLSSAEAATSYSCETTFDKLNIPHVKTTSVEGFYYCFGLQHGQDRAWEMDFFRRVGEGRNAEIMGYSQLKSDLMMRLLDLPAVAEKIWSGFPADKKRLIEIYAEGANEGFKTGKKSTEFKDKNFEPEPWKPQHTILVLLLQSFDQTRKTFYRDYEEEKLKEKWGEKTADLFNEDNMPWENTILKKGEYTPSKTVVSRTYTNRKLNLWSDFPYVFGKEEAGSNNWVISSAKSKQGHAMLANDPHLDLKTPMFWYWINIKTPEASVMGGSVPGVPVVPSGTNGKVAWGLTNSYLNSADAVFVRDLNTEDIESFRPTVYIKFWIFKIPFFFKSFEKLKSGQPILPLDVESEQKIALRWTGFSLKASELFPMFDIYRMQNVTEMDHLIAQIGIPSWNFVFADSKGDIGYRLVGRPFKLTEKNPMGIQEMTLAEFQNEQYLAPDDRPHVLKPKRQYVYSANNRHWPSDAQFYGGRGYSYSFRGQRIDEMLQDKQDLESFKNIQCDTMVVDAKYFVPKLQKYLNAAEFKDWSLGARSDSKALPVYRRLMDLIFEKWSVNEYALFRLLDKLSSEQEKELKTLYQTALNDIAGRTWDHVHFVKFPHMASDQWIFSPEIPGIGDSHTVNPGTAHWNNDRKIYVQYSGASMRMIVELKETPIVWLTLPGLNRHYDNKKDNTPWESWKKCEYTEVQF